MTLWEYDPAIDQWIEKANLSSASEGGTGFSLGNKGYAISGYDRHIHQYNAYTNEWKVIRTDHYLNNLFDVGVSIQGKGYMIDTENNFYEFTPPQD